MSVAVHHSDMLAWLAAYDGPLFDSVVCDPPYHLTSIVKRFGKPGSAEAKVGATGAYARAARDFMGKEWDGGDIAFRPETWRAVFDKMKPGSHLVAFSGTRTYHRMACAIEDAGFEIRDQLAWIYGSGFPKSHDVSKGMDKAAGAVREVVGTRKLTGKARVLKGGNYEGGYDGRELTTDYSLTAPATPDALAWQGWGTALKPAHEPICLARKPLSEKSIAANVLRWGTGAINVDACRVGVREKPKITNPKRTSGTYGAIDSPGGKLLPDARWPANLLHDGSDEVLARFPDTGPATKGIQRAGGNPNPMDWGKPRGDAGVPFGHEDGGGSAARYFYSAKAGPLDRLGSAHATVKPVDVMRWLCRLVTPPGGLVLDPFAGSGTTGIAAMAEGFDCEMVELEADHFADIERKLAFLRGEGRMAFREHDRKRDDAPVHAGPLFGAAA